MRKFLLLTLCPVLAFAWGPFQATSMKRVQGMDWSWALTTSTPQISLELDCQSFIHQFHQSDKGRRVMSIVMEEPDCQSAAKAFRKCFPFPGKACVKGTALPEVTCGSCPQ